MNIKFWRFLQCFWSYFIGIGALGGVAMMLLIPEFFAWGDTSLLDYMQVLPWPQVFFTNFIFPAVCLCCAIALPNAICIALIHKRHKLGPVASLACGIILMCWICIQFVIFPGNFLSRIYFCFGILQALGALGWLAALKRVNANFGWVEGR